MKKKRKKRSYFAIAIVVLFLCGLVTYQKYELVDTLEQNQKQLDALEEEKKGLLKEKDEISDYEAYVQTKKYIEEIAREKGIKLTVNRVGGMMTVFFTDRNPVRSYDDAKSCDLEMFKKYFLHMLNSGFNIPQSQFESMFLSAVHTEEHIDKFLEAFRQFEA